MHPGKTKSFLLCVKNYNMHRAPAVFDYYSSRYGRPTVFISAAGRANIIGEHTDYHEGYVMPFAIDTGIHFCAGPCEDRESTITSLDFAETYHHQSTPAKGSWQLYVHGLLQDLKTKYKIEKLPNIVFGGDLPMGAGVSSSSALCCGLIETFDAYYQLGLSSMDKVLWASEIEHGTGVRGGKMDQYAICHGQVGTAMLLDCRSMQHKLISLPDSWQFLLINTGVKHNLAFTAYNERRAEAEFALNLLQQKFPHLKTLRDADATQIDQCLEKGSKHYNRAMHVVAENKRVLAFELSATLGDIRSAGRLMDQSHSSLRDLYEVSCPELDYLQVLAAKSTSVYGSRMMGGGFGGCTIHLIQELDEAEIKGIQTAYEKKFGHFPASFVVHPAQGLIRHD